MGDRRAGIGSALQGRRQSPVSVRIGKLDPGFAAFASASGNTLTIRGHTINIDGRALSHDLFPIGIAGPNTFLPRATVNQLTIIPATGYGFQPGSGIVADLSYGIGRDGGVDFPESCGGFLAGKGTSTLVILGYPMVLNAAHADSDLVGIANVGVRAETPRELVATLVPAKSYLPQTAKGVCGTGFNIERDGRITFDPAAVGSYVVTNSSSPNPSQAGEEVAIGVYVRPNAPARLTPQGNVTFTVGNTLLGGANRPFPAAFAWMYRAAGGLAVCRRNGLRDRMTNVI